MLYLQETRGGHNYTFALAATPDGSTLYAGSCGRGVYRLGSQGPPLADGLPTCRADTNGQDGTGDENANGEEPNGDGEANGNDWQPTGRGGGGGTSQGGGLCGLGMILLLACLPLLGVWEARRTL
ncbi:MAG: hypothetical protein ACYS7M_12360 [Planctomycetota bacterium]|jgi:hypothetical protein